MRVSQVSRGAVPTVLHNPEDFQCPLSVLEPYSPFHRSVWYRVYRPIKKYEVAKALAARKLISHPVEYTTRRCNHVRRIAYLVGHKQSDPIHLNVGQYGHGLYNEWIVVDGHHRLAAAFYRGDSHIRAMVYGSYFHAQEKLGLKFHKTRNFVEV
jgi:hypothetical protein